MSLSTSADTSQRVNAAVKLAQTWLPVVDYGRWSIEKDRDKEASGRTAGKSYTDIFGRIGGFCRSHSFESIICQIAYGRMIRIAPLSEEERES
jgi:hypothetical protein